MSSPLYGSGPQDFHNDAELAVARPQTGAEWAAWHHRRDTARRVIAKVTIRVGGVSSGEMDGPATAQVRQLLTEVLGLDPDTEAEIINRQV